MIAAWVLAFWNLNGVYLFVGGLGLLALVCFAYGYSSRDALEADPG